MSLWIKCHVVEEVLVPEFLTRHFDTSFRCFLLMEYGNLINLDASEMERSRR